MDIVYLGHSAFRLRGRDATIVTDPYAPDGGAPMGAVSADVVTVSSPGPDHSFVQGVGGEPRFIAGPGEYEVAGVLIAGVATALEPGKGPANTAYVFRMDDLVICHLGHLTGKLSNDQVENIGNIDVLMVPVGSGGALDAVQATEVVQQLDPMLVIPMHYQEQDGGSLDAFLRETGSRDVKPEAKLTVTKGSLPQEVRVVVLEPRRV